MRGNKHLIIPEEDFTLDMSLEELEDISTLYLWGTKTAIRRFCNTCGILPWYRPRSNPDGYGITYMCMTEFQQQQQDQRPPNLPQIEFRSFDGQNWEECFLKSNIQKESKTS